MDVTEKQTISLLTSPLVAAMPPSMVTSFFIVSLMPKSSMHCLHAAALFSCRDGNIQRAPK